MALGSFVLLLGAVGVVLYLVNKITMDATIKKILNIVVIIVVVLFVLQLFGILPELQRLRVGR